MPYHDKKPPTETSIPTEDELALSTDTLIPPISIPPPPSAQLRGNGGSADEMIKVIQFENLKNLNTSLQVGDQLYGCNYTGLLDNINYVYDDPGTQGGIGNAASNDARNGRVVKIERIANGWNLYVALPINQALNQWFQVGDFIMFSKAPQSDGNIKGYYAETRFINNSPLKAELFSISSEVTESSK